MPYHVKSVGALGTGDIEDKKILIKSNGIFITGKNVNLNSDNVKLGNGADQSVVRGDDLKKFLNELLTDLDVAFAAGMAAITPAGVIVTGGSAAPAPYKTAIQTIKAKLAKSTMLSDKVKTG